MTTDAQRQAARVARTIAAVAAVGVLCLVVFTLVGGPFGFLNDLANATVGLLSAALAWLLQRGRANAWSLVAALIGGVVMVFGSVLVMADVTGWYLAGLVSAVGSALIGLWVLAVNGMQPVAGELSSGLRRLGLIAGAVMLTGLLALPGVLGGVDDASAASWGVSAGLVSWLGTYVLYPVWCWLVSRQLSAQNVNTPAMTDEPET